MTLFSFATDMKERARKEKDGEGMRGGVGLKNDSLSHGKRATTERKLALYPLLLIVALTGFPPLEAGLRETYYLLYLLFKLSALLLFFVFPFWQVLEGGTFDGVAQRNPSLVFSTIPG